jgi:hypothetical protein
MIRQSAKALPDRPRSIRGRIETRNDPREQVERYLQTNGKGFKQMCCVANFKGKYVSFDRAGYDDLVKIAEESVPFVCSENDVYIAFEFNPKSEGERSNTNGSDILKKVSVFRQLEG